MKKVPEHVLSNLSGRFGLTVADLTQFGGGREDSDGVVYKFVKQNKEMVLKIIVKRTDDVNAALCVRERAVFFSFLGDCGVDVVSPIIYENGALIEECVDENDCFIAYVYPYLTGRHPQPNEWNAEMLSTWGRVVGLAHKSTKEYAIWDGIIAPRTGRELLTWRAEIESFANWCSDEQVKAYWIELYRRIEILPYTRENAGFIHNDPHMQNILFDNGRIKLLDFDVANCHFFACDIAIAIQSVLFTTSGGMDCPVYNRDALVNFVHPFLEGYCMENNLPRNASEQIELFIAYRRALLFTVLQDWLATQPEKKSSWKKLVLEEPPIMKGLSF